MPFFFDLPRELRDLIYTEIILWERPRPILGHPQWLTFRFRRVTYAQSSVTGEYGCAYALDGTPTTCANLLCCNRQVNSEMLEVLELIKRQDRRSHGEVLAATLDCIAEDESFHYFTWLKVPLVETTSSTVHHSKSMLPKALDSWMEKWLSWPHGWILSNTRLLTAEMHMTTLKTLWINIRIAGDRSRKFYRNSTQADRTSWAICATLKRLLDHGPHLSISSAESSAPPPPPSPRTGSSAFPALKIDRLVLNVIPPDQYPASSFLPVETQNNEVRQGLVHPQSVARELLDVWTKIWTRSEYKGVLYHGLLEGIGEVSVCVEGSEVGSRPLGRELMRGRGVGGGRR